MQDGYIAGAVPLVMDVPTDDRPEEPELVGDRAAPKACIWRFVWSWMKRE